MRKIFAGGVAACFLIAVSSYWWVIQGPWLDRTASSLASKKFHVNARFKNVRISRWSDIRFDSFILASSQGEQWINAGRGEISFRSLFFLRKPPQVFQVRLERVIVLRDFYKSGFMIPFSPPKWLEQSSVIDEIYLRVAENAPRTSVQIFQVKSSRLGLRGGMRFEGKRIIKAHLVVSVAEEVLGELPGMLRSRLFQTADGREGARIVYSKNTVTAIGHSGPFFKFQWRPGA